MTRVRAAKAASRTRGGARLLARLTATCTGAGGAVYAATGNPRAAAAVYALLAAAAGLGAAAAWLCRR